MQDKIKDWLLKGGFPFEMKVSNMFIDAGFSVAQSVYYKDIEEGKYRETDILAYRCQIINGVFVNITFVIECKSSLDKPWIILKNDRLSNSIDEHNKIFYSDRFKTSFNKIKESSLKSDLIFKNNVKYGYSLVTAFNNGNDRAYEAIQTTLKSCEYLVNATDESLRERVCNLYFPVVIVKGQLFNATMTTNNDLDLSKIDNGQIILSRSYHEYHNSVIRILNDEKLEENIKLLVDQCDDFFKKYESILKKNISKS